MPGKTEKFSVHQEIFQQISIKLICNLHQLKNVFNSSEKFRSRRKSRGMDLFDCFSSQSLFSFNCMLNQVYLLLFAFLIYSLERTIFIRILILFIVSLKRV